MVNQTDQSRYRSIDQIFDPAISIQNLAPAFECLDAFEYSHCIKAGLF